MIAFFEARAWWFVALAWLLFPLAVLIGVASIIASGISLTYFPQHQQAPIDRLYQYAAYVVMPLSLAVALASTLLTAEKCRRAAITLVVGGWGVIAFGFGLATLLVKPGPEYIERYAGAERFSVPWRYQPLDADHTSQNGFAIRLCLDSLQGVYDEECGSRSQAWVYPYVQSLGDIATKLGWHRGLMAGTSLDGHELYEGLRTRYYLRTDTRGQITRFVYCSRSSCRHHVITPHYVLAYDGWGQFADWQMMDHKLIDLISSWRVQ
jgi:hypothetical protein